MAPIVAKRAPLGEIPVNRSRQLAAKPPQDPGLKDNSSVAAYSVAAYSDDDSGSDTDEEAWLDDVDLEKIETLMRRTDKAITTTRDATRAVHALYRNDFVLAAEMVEAEAQARRARASNSDGEAARSMSSSSGDETDCAIGTSQPDSSGIHAARVKGRATSRRWMLATLAIVVTAAALGPSVKSFVDAHSRPPRDAPLPVSIHPLANLMCG